MVVLQIAWNFLFLGDIVFYKKNINTFNRLLRHVFYIGCLVTQKDKFTSGI